MATFYCRQPFTENLWIAEGEDKPKAIQLMLQYAENHYNLHQFYQNMQRIKEMCESDGVDLHSYPSYAADLREWLEKNLEPMQTVMCLDR